MITDLPPPLAAVASPGVPGAEPPPDPGLLLLHLGVEALEEVLLLLEVGGHTPLAADRDGALVMEMNFVKVHIQLN